MSGLFEPPATPPATPAPAAPATPPAEPPATPPASSGEPAPPAAWWQSGELKQGWTQGLPEDIRDAAKGLEKYKSVDDIVKGLVNAQSMLGKRVEIKPMSGMTPEEKSDLFTKLGAPNSPDAYAKPEDVAEENWKHVAEAAMVQGIHPEQLDAVYKEFAKGFTQAVQQDKQAEAAAAAQAAEVFRKEWGSRYDSNRQELRQYLEKEGIPLDSPMLHNPEVVRALYARATEKGGSVREPAMFAKGTAAGDPVDVESAIATIMRKHGSNVSNYPPDVRAKYSSLIAVKMRKA